MKTFIKKLINRAKKKPTIKAIAAIDLHNGIGYRGDLIYKIPTDMKHFVKMTGIDPVIMRSGTFESFGSRPLPNRKNIVISRKENYTGNGAIVVKTLDEALYKIAYQNVAWIIGGAGLYREALPLCDELYITQIFGEKPADTFFPEFKNHFELSSQSEKYFDEKNNVEYQFQVWKNKNTQ